MIALHNPGADPWGGGGGRGPQAMAPRWLSPVRRPALHNGTSFCALHTCTDHVHTLQTSSTHTQTITCSSYNSARSCPGYKAPFGSFHAPTLTTECLAHDYVSQAPSSISSHIARQRAPSRPSLFAAPSRKILNPPT